ncbi:hypothetical protein TNCV_1279691 [Trichonephila clavipes]|nr:hypothetical protein TNCV_1279691 [Trichonephila clavipes]
MTKDWHSTLSSSIPSKCEDFHLQQQQSVLSSYERHPMKFAVLLGGSSVEPGLEPATSWVLLQDAICTLIDSELHVLLRVQPSTETLQPTELILFKLCIAKVVYRNIYRVLCLLSVSTEFLHILAIRSECYGVALFSVA